MSDPRQFNVDDFRAEAHAFIEWIAAYLTNIDTYPVRAQVEPGLLRAALPATPPTHAEPVDALLDDLERLIVPGLTHWQSPNFFAYFPANNSIPSIMGELVSAALGVQGMLWITSPACTELETHVLDWLVDLCGMPSKFKSTEQGGGVLEDSASSSVLCALLAARERVTQGAANEAGCRGDLVVYGSRETHSSLDKAVMIAGIGRRNLRKIEVDSVNAMKPATLAAQIAADRAAGLIPTMVCATLGTTSTLAFDPLPPIAEICQREGIWLHVDAALAGSAAVCPEYQPLLRGLESVDSYCFNPHKWLLTNFDCTCFFVSDRTALVKALAINPSYLNNAATAAGTVIDYRDWQIPLGRRFRALKLWFVMRRFGVAGLQEHIRRQVELTAQFAAMVADDLRFEIVAPVTLNLVCFRYRGANEINERILNILNASGKLFISHTMLNERFVLRFCVGQPRTEFRHVQSAWQEIQAALTRCLI